MKIASLATLVLASTAVNATALPKDGGGTKSKNNPQEKASNCDGKDPECSHAGASLGKENEITSKFTSYLSERSGAIPDNAVKTFQDLVLEFPNEMSQLTLQIPSDTIRLNSASKNRAKFDCHASDAQLPNHKLRVKSTPGKLGVDSVKQYSGYLDVEDEDKHFFYWFFESRNDPKNDPIILWLNGGPGASSLTGLFFELGPSSINAKLQPEFNPYSWNNNASVIFLDSPVNVGFSYSSQTVDNAVLAGKDVFAFLELFFKQFPEYQKLDFHIAGESYGGHYIPNISKQILKHPKRSFNFKSILIGNGFTDPLTQFAYYQPMACGAGGEPAVLSNEVCQRMASSISRCTSLLEDCYNTGSIWSCVPASMHCYISQTVPLDIAGFNKYDIRLGCKGGGSCYNDFKYIQDYLNLPEVRKNLGVEVEHYVRFDGNITEDFFFSGDIVQPYQKHVTDILESEIPVLIYAGDKDFTCNWLGIEAWTEKLPWSGQAKFKSQPTRDWIVKGKPAGKVKNYKHFTFLRVFDAGHLVPHNQPENSLDMVNRWVSGDYQL